MPGTDRLEELASELDRIGGQLADAAMDLLRDALDEASEAAAVLATRRERLVNRARSSVDKAVTLLGQAAVLTEAGGRDQGTKRAAEADEAEDEGDY